MLELNVMTDSETFRKDGAVHVKVQLTNAGEAPVLINNRLALNDPGAPPEAREISFAVTDPTGKPVFFGARLNPGRPDARHFKALGPGASIERVYDLSDYYRFEVTGRYAIQASYQNQSDPGDGSDSWKGAVKSNVGSVVIVSE